MMTFDAQLEQYQARCTAALETAVASRFQPGSEVSRAAEYALINGGKRVRGVLVLASCALHTEEERVADAFAAALEMVHAFSLVHDDLPCMDDDDMRRGQPAAHIAFGEANALLAGDLLALQAFEVLAHSGAAAFQVVQAVDVLAKAAGAKGMIYGQELDLYHEGKPVTEEILRTIQTHKTGALIRAAMQLGAVAAGRDANKAAVVRFGDAVGRVFQMVDDVLDVTSTDEVLGKPAGSDAQQHKSTMVSLLGVEETRRRAAALTEAATSELQSAYGTQNAAFLCEYATRLLARIN